MKSVVGMVIGRTSVSVAVVRGDVIDWLRESAIDAEEERRAVVRSLLETIPSTRRRRLALGVLVEPPLVQVRRLEGLPPVDERLLARLVSENAPALFLKRDGGMAIGKVHRMADGLWGAAFDRDVVEEIAAVAADLRFDLRGIAPVDAFREPIAFGSNDLCACAVGITSSTPLVWTRKAAEGRGVAPRRLRIAMVAALFVSGIAAWSAPIVRAVADERRMGRALAGMRDVEAEALRSVTELRLVTQSLDERAAFDARREGMTVLVDEIARALPESTALLSFRADSLDVNLVALGPRVTEVLPALGRVSGSHSVRVVGTLSHELVDGVRLERAAFRFRRATHPNTR